MINTKDIRQSDSWSKYMEIHGWESKKLSRGSVLRTTKFIILNRVQILRPDLLSENDMEEIDNHCINNDVLFSKISPNTDQNVNILKSYGYKVTKKIDLSPKNMIINLENKQTTTWDSISSGCRYSINKSSRDKDYVEFISNPNKAQLKKFLDALTKRSRRKKFYIPGVKDFIKLVEVFNKDLFIGNVYNQNNELLGTKMFIGYKKCVWGTFAATTDIGQKSCGGYKLLWESLRHFKKLGYQLMDLGGLEDDRIKTLSKNWEGYSFFKKQFNGEVHTYPMTYIKYFKHNLIIKKKFK